MQARRAGSLGPLRVRSRLPRDPSRVSA
jgi:hypothetical protein